MKTLKTQNRFSHFSAKGNLHFARGDVAGLARASRRYAEGASAAEAAAGNRACSKKMLTFRAWTFGSWSKTSTEKLFLQDSGKEAESLLLTMWLNGAQAQLKRRGPVLLQSSLLSCLRSRNDVSPVWLNGLLKWSFSSLPGCQGAAMKKPLLSAKKSWQLAPMSRRDQTCTGTN